MHVEMRQFLDQLTFMLLLLGLLGHLLNGSLGLVQHACEFNLLST
jgi:hypothetical protein